MVLSGAPLQEQGLDQIDHLRLSRNPRYEFFIRVDEEAMQSVLEAAELGYKTGKQPNWDHAWVDVVHVRWPDDETSTKHRRTWLDILANLKSRVPPKAGDFPPIEGITCGEVGFQRILIDQLYPTAWRDLDMMPWKFYWRPPEISYPTLY
jgi:hypothetical protein